MVITTYQKELQILIFALIFIGQQFILSLPNGDTLLLVQTVHRHGDRSALVSLKVNTSVSLPLSLYLLYVSPSVSTSVSTSYSLCLSPPPNRLLILHEFDTVAPRRVSLQLTGLKALGSLQKKVIYKKKTFLEK